MNIRAGSLAIAAAILLAACTDGGAGTPTGTTSVAIGASASLSPSAATSSTVSSTTASTKETAVDRADEVARAYYRAQTKCLTNPKDSPPTCFDAVAVGTELLNMRNALSSAQQMQTRVIGDIAVVSVTPTKVSLANDAKATPPVVPTVTLRVCRDLTNFNIVDKNGKSIVPAGRKPRGVDVVSVYNYELPNPAKWRVGYVAMDREATC